MIANMLKYFIVKRKTFLVLTVAMAISLYFLHHEFIGKDSQTTWDHKLRHQLNSDGLGETLRSKELSEPSDHKDSLPSGQSIKYIGQHPTCSQSEQSTGQVLCSTLRKSTPTGKEDLNVTFDPIRDEELEAKHGGDLEPGGLYHPKDCSPDQRVAIIVPYQDRDEHLKVLLNHLHPFLKKQKIQYMIIVVEQAQGTKFNRAMLRNIGFVEGEKLCNFDCYFFHDVDMIPLRDDNIYQCADIPRHHAASLARWNFTLPYSLLIGGVASFSRDVFKKVNGYSNLYFGWGAEDDDLALRMKLLHSWYTRVNTDGLNSLKYHIHTVEFRKLYTRIYVRINETEVLEQFPNAFNETVETFRQYKIRMHSGGFRSNDGKY